MEDSDDEDLEVLAKDNDMINEGQRCVKAVFRTMKFISNSKQEEIFCDAVMDNYGKEELLSFPGEPDDEDDKKCKNEATREKLKEIRQKLVSEPDDTEERKRQVTRFRKVFKKTYGKGWVSYLNTHRSYTQVSEQCSKMYTTSSNF